MHRYFARRPYTLVSDLISHYTDPGETVLDPFFGGGVTLVEAALAGRTPLGFDINPLATFVTRMELERVDVDAFAEEIDILSQKLSTDRDIDFRTQCPHCSSPARVLWFEHSYIASCFDCGSKFPISSAKKVGIGRWECDECKNTNRFSASASSATRLISLLYNCEECGITEIAAPSDRDIRQNASATTRLVEAESNGLWVPNAEIPDCNMQRESALHKKGITKYRQLFTEQHLLALGKLRQHISNMESPVRDWLLFAFSSTLRYTNRMATRNPQWRGNRPLEWAKPGFWLPAVFLEANVLEEFLRRCSAIRRGKADYLKKLPTPDLKMERQPRKALSSDAKKFHVSTRSVSSIPLPDASVDAIITDPPYGSYVHYADLCNFWSVWLPEIDGLGNVIDDKEEAVIARKSFPGSKTTECYQSILEKCFVECERVLKQRGRMVLTFNNREPRAWAALLTAVLKAGFELVEDGIIFQDGVSSYKHTSQSRRNGSVIGDFVFTFSKKSNNKKCNNKKLSHNHYEFNDREYIRAAKLILKKNGPLSPNELFTKIYIWFIPKMVKTIESSLEEGRSAMDRLLNEADEVRLFDSHRRALLEKHLVYVDDHWSIRGST
jgi:DNA modification methylase